jgi:hypothetical protein
MPGVAKYHIQRSTCHMMYMSCSGLVWCFKKGLRDSRRIDTGSCDGCYPLGTTYATSLLKAISVKHMSNFAALSSVMADSWKIATAVINKQTNKQISSYIGLGKCYCRFFEDVFNDWLSGIFLLISELS